VRKKERKRKQKSGRIKQKGREGEGRERGREGERKSRPVWKINVL